jgi:hypothetical protein
LLARQEIEIRAGTPKKNREHCKKRNTPIRGIEPRAPRIVKNPSGYESAKCWPL